MRLDVLSIAALIFVFGLFLSSLSLSDVFEREKTPPAPHQQGFNL